MRKTGLIVGACAALIATGQAIAAPAMLYPVQLGAETVHYARGVPNLDLVTPTGAVRLTPLPDDHGRFSFGVAVYNRSYTPVTFDIGDVAVQAGSETLALLSKDQLVAKARSRAIWSAVGMTMLVGVAAAAQANSYSTRTYRSHVRTPYGNSFGTVRVRDNGAGLQNAALTEAVGVVAIDRIGERLGASIEAMNDEIVQKTTIEPGGFYAGRIVIEKPKDHALPQDLRIAVNVGGVAYPFALRLAQEGHDLPPPFRPATAPVPAAAIALPPTQAPVVIASAAALPSTAGASPVSAQPYPVSYPIRSGVQPAPAVQPRTTPTQVGAIYGDVPVAPSAL